ncbi:phage antirepressor KilAC domain-containing protein [Lacticaseibacillus baoqingensis]|uniref:Phage antirepressor KilAC domain-containing protein n=1 Tax=Lacticaseibacillus baoqingensis TaxID=2486013 RepID=A0ABW4E8D2_9LACO|nr:phage antirepressor KilAC domain-containing protein [Lacticaseibacillus baoqingensis]
MNELIKVVENGQHQQVVSARELHAGLEVKTRFSLWTKQNFGGFSEGTDFTSVVTTTVVNNGGKRELQDYAITIDMAKNLALMSKTPRGAMYRAYLIEVENKWNDPAEVIRRGYALLLDENKQLKVENAKMAPKVEYFDKQMHNPGLMTTTVIAKRFGKSAIWLNRWLSSNGLIYRQGNNWVVRQKFAAEGYAGYENWSDADNSHVVPLLKWTQKGQKFIYDCLIKEGVQPVMVTMRLEGKEATK